MCRQTLRNEVPAAGKPALSCHLRLVSRKRPSPAHLSDILFSFHFGLSGSPAAVGESPMAPRRSWAKADNPFWSNHVVAWYRSALDAEHYCRKHDLSTASLMRWARHLLSAEDLQAYGRSAEIAPEKAGKAAEERAAEQAQEASAQIATACIRIAVRWLFRRSGACMSKR